MSNALLNIVKKELKEIIRDPRLFVAMILLPILIMPIMGIVFQGFMSQATESAKGEVKIAVLNLDEGNVSDIIINSPDFRLALESLNISLIYLNELGFDSVNNSIDYIFNNGSIKAMVVLPENFTYCVIIQSPIKLSIYYFIQKDNPSAVAAVSSRISIFTQLLKQIISTYVILNIDPSANPVFIQNPIVSEPNTIYEGKIISRTPPELIIQAFFMQTLMMPIAVMMLLSIAIQFAATSIASEKEQKTLEILLTMPIDRETILFGKLTGAILVSILGTIGYAIGFQFYMQSITSPIGTEEGIQINLSDIGLGIDPFGFILMAASLFLSLLAILALVMILASFAEDVRTAQSLTSFVFMPVTLVGFIAIFAIAVGVSPIWMQIMLFIPFTSPMIAPLYVISKQYFNVIIGLLALLIETIVSIKIAAKFYGSEMILSARLRFRKKGREKEVE